MFAELKFLTLKNDKLFFSQYPGIFGNQQEYYKDVIHQMLNKCLQDSETKNVNCSTNLLYRMNYVINYLLFIFFKEKIMCYFFTSKEAFFILLVKISFARIY